MDEETKILELLDKLEKGMTTEIDTRFEPVNTQYKTMQERIDALETKLNTPEAGPLAAPDVKAIDAEWRKDYITYITTGKEYDQFKHIDAYKDAVPEAKKEMISLTQPTGGYWMPATMSNRLVEAILAISPFRQLASVETLRVGDRLQMVGEVGGIVLAGRTSEGAPKVASLTDTLMQYEIPTHGYYGMPTLTYKMATQAAIDVEAYVVRKAAEYIGFLENHDFVVGTGIGQAEGLVTRGAVHVAANTAARHEHTGGATSIPDLDGLIRAQDKLNDKYQPNASWLMHRTTKSVLRTLTDGMGRYILEENVQVGQPDRLFGRPIFYMPDMATVTTPPTTFTAAAIPIIYGDIRQCYQIVDIPGIRQVRDEISTKGLIQLYTERSTGGQVVDDNAFVVMNVSA